jgi:hypothetical protein
MKEITVIVGGNDGDGQPREVTAAVFLSKSSSRLRRSVPPFTEYIDKIITGRS